MNIIIVNNNEYQIIKLLGKGKGGYSYLVTKDNELFVAKKIHHEPCSYYTFNNKLESEINNYKYLKRIGLLLPNLYEIDYNQEIILKEYIDGTTIMELIKKDINVDNYVEQMYDICKILYKNNTNIDYFPTNFIVKNNSLYYVDYECNKYLNEWNFENWGIKYWSKTNEFLEYLKGESNE